MPPRKQPRSVAEQVQDEINQEIDDLVTEIAAEEGPAPHAQYVSEEQELRLWGAMDPTVDHPTLVGQLMAGAVPPELLDPSGDRALALVKANPEMAQLFAEPLDEEMATMTATLAEYPFRLSLLQPHADDPEATVKKADSLTARWRKRFGSAAGISAAPTSPQAPVQPLGAPAGYPTPPAAPEPLLSPPAAAVAPPGVPAPPRDPFSQGAGPAPVLPPPPPRGY